VSFWLGKSIYFYFDRKTFWNSATKEEFGQGNPIFITKMIHRFSRNPIGFPLRNPIVLVLFLVTCILLTVLIDFLESQFQNSGFYISESLLFSSYWWIFLPLWYGQLSLSNLCKTKACFAALVILPILIHLFAFPALVWLISSLLYSHTFEFRRTFEFGLTQHFFKIFLLYTIPIGLFSIFKERLTVYHSSTIPLNHEADDFLTSVAVKDGNRQLYIPTKEILYFSANPPYTNIMHHGKKYLYNMTLKSLSEKLDNRLFVRIHKSEIVNLSKVQSYQSRQNGDYDVTISDSSVLRISRNFAKDFKTKLDLFTQDKA